MTFNILPAWEGQSLYIFSHAALLYTTKSGGETGWGGDNILNDAQWNFYIHVVPPTYVPTTTTYYSVSGYVFRDLNGNGDMDSGEAGLPGVSLTLSDGNTTTSGADGSYLFDHLKGGLASYNVQAGNLQGEYHMPYLNPVTAWAGKASSANVNLGFSHETVAGVVFYDANHNDVYDAGEPTLSGFTVRLGSTFAVSDSG
ncbi:MAG: hypothetical protein NT061_13630 [Spirochaetes bacterium]|nr:hypothetical protein [Spirochaetota bacterium]